MRAGIRLAVDVGSARIGLAHCDPDGLMASPLTTVLRGAGDVERIDGLAAAEAAIEIIVGLPTTLAGREGSAAEDARSFAATLAATVTVPVRLVDERFTTVIAHEELRRGGKNSKRRRSVVDRTAAALLLQGALDRERATGRPAGELVRPLSGGLA